MAQNGPFGFVDRPIDQPLGRLQRRVFGAGAVLHGWI